MKDGITLVALIITVVILIILASISISALKEGEFIVLSVKGSQDYAEEQEYESIMMENYKGVLGAVVENIAEAGKTPPEKQKEKLILAPYETDNYGKYIDIGVDVVGKEGDTTDDWMIFYETDKRIYLIAADYVPNTKIPESIKTATGIQTSNNNVSKWEGSSLKDYPTESGYITEELKKEFMLGEYDIAGNAGSHGNSNSKAAASLLNAPVWKELLDGSSLSTNNQVHVIGGVTLPMWVDSWNKKYGKEKTLDCTKTDGNGYYLNQSFLSLTNSENLSSTSAYKNHDKLYFPQKASSDGASGYWIASPSKGFGTGVFGVGTDGKVDDNIYTTSHAVRPLISIPNDMSITKVEEGTDLYTIDE